MTRVAANPAALEADAIELANAYGPYTHGTWTAQDVAVGNEEALAGRAAFIADHIRRAILARFPPDRLRQMTLVDVGCYDGWITCQLEDLPLARLIGIEPRRKNLEKGRMIRSLLGIQTRCEFRQGSLETLEETLGGDRADIVVCSGLFHHLASVADGVMRLRAICREFLFLETLCLPEGFEDARLREAMELKDLPYFFGEKRFGLTGHKLESGYYDGSATRLSVVSLPSVETLRLFLDVEGFTDVEVVADPESYRRAVPGGWRSFSAVCMTAVPAAEAADAARWIRDYERGLVQTLLPLPVTTALFARHVANAPVRRPPALALDISRMLGAANRGRGATLARLKKRLRSRYLFEIVKNLRFAPRDKISLEHGKSLAAAGRLAEAKTVLAGITRRLNADWRAVYRAFCVLAWVHREQGELRQAERYEELCRVANPQFPAELLAESLGLLGRAS